MADLPAAFAWRFSPVARDDFEYAANWLDSVSPGSGLKFAHALRATLTDLGQRWAAGFRPAPHPEASAYFTVIVYQELMRTQRTGRRSAAGVWRIFYDVEDANTDGMMDTIRVISIRHGAARPVWEPEEREDAP